MVIDHSTEDVIRLVVGLWFYINETITCKKANLKLPEDIQCIAVETNLRARKWLIVGLHKPPDQHEGSFLLNLIKCFRKLIETHSSTNLPIYLT